MAGARSCAMWSVPSWSTTSQPVAKLPGNTACHAACPNQRTGSLGSHDVGSTSSVLARRTALCELPSCKGFQAGDGTQGGWLVGTQTFAQVQIQSAENYCRPRQCWFSHSNFEGPEKAKRVARQAGVHAPFAVSLRQERWIDQGMTCSSRKLHLLPVARPASA